MRGVIEQISEARALQARPSTSAQLMLPNKQSENASAQILGFVGFLNHAFICVGYRPILIDSIPRTKKSLGDLCLINGTP
jgi:hypothetical protein